ncbi:MAG: hypothetical protein Q4G52_07890, partial [Clostridia bacterium]|nr:hypothetical protein [Clostridia bacterium]
MLAKRGVTGKRQLTGRLAFIQKPYENTPKFKSTFIVPVSLFRGQKRRECQDSKILTLLFSHPLD